MVSKRFNHNLPMGGPQVPFELQSFMRAVQGFSLFNMFGSKEAITDQWQDLWEHTSNLQWLTSAETITIVSDSAQDGPSGTGALTGYVFGLDENWNILNEEITFNGTTPVVTTNRFIRINDVAVRTCGSTESNVGTITYTATTSGYLQRTIEPVVGRSHGAFLSVASTDIAWCRSLVLGVRDGNSPRVDVGVFRRQFGEGWRRIGDITFTGSGSTPSLDFGAAAKSDLKLMVRRDSAGVTDVQGFLQVMFGDKYDEPEDL